MRQLSPRLLAAFGEWFAEFDAVLWDLQLEEDIAARKLDRFAEEPV